MKLLLIDESKANDFLLCVVEIDFKNVTSARKVLRSVRKKRQSTVHFVKESSARKKQVLREFQAIAFHGKIYSVSNLNQESSRKLAFAALVSDLASGTRYSLVIDRDENYESLDRKVIKDILVKNGNDQLVDYRHDEPRFENLLSIPDAIAWSYARGGEWREMLQTFDICLVKLREKPR